MHLKVRCKQCFVEQEKDISQLWRKPRITDVIAKSLLVRFPDQFICECDSPQEFVEILDK